MVSNTSRWLFAALVWAAGCHLVTGADKYHVVEPEDQGGADAGPGGTGGGAPTGGSAQNQCQGVMGCEQCASCARNGPCTDEANNCNASPPCIDFQSCMLQCGASNDCWNMCAYNHPEGEAPELAWVMCVECRACPGQCWVPQACR